MSLHYKQHVGLKYAELVYFGLWFTPLREALDAFVDEHAEERDGHASRSRCTRETFRWSSREVGVLAVPDRSVVVHHGRQLRPEGRGGIHPHSGPAFAIARATREEVATMKMWSGRFRQPLDPEFERWQRSFRFRSPSAAVRTRGQQCARARAEKCRHPVVGRTDQHRAGVASRLREGGFGIAAFLAR